MYIYLNMGKQMIDIKLLPVHSNTWNHLTVCKKLDQVCLKMLWTKLVFTNVYLIHMYKQDRVWNNLQ